MNPRRALRRALAAARGRERLVRADYYSPVPDLDTLPPAAWERRSALAGIDFDLDAQLRFAETELAPFIAELRPGDLVLENGYYEAADSELAYAMVRRLRPRRVVELGSGWSSLVLAAACRRNAGEDAPVEYVAYDPHPGGAFAATPEGMARLETVPAQEVDPAVFAGLADGDVLFVDTTHTVKLGGDVNFIVCDVLPTLAPGVAVHFHDIWLPYEYHRMLVEGMGMYWNEQYLLQAFLTGSPDWEVLVAVQALARERPDRLRALIPSYEGDNHPSAFWIRRRDRSAH